MRTRAATSNQSLFLDPEDYVVPATTLRCVPLSRRQKWHDEEVVPTIPGTSCALLVVATFHVILVHSFTGA